MDFNLTTLRREAKFFRKVSPRMTIRVLALIELTKRRQKKRNWRLGDPEYELIASRFALSGRSLRRYEKAYQKGGVGALAPRPIRGRRAVPIRGRLAQRIVGWRKRYGWGAEVIAAHLLHDHQMRVGRFRLERFLRKKGLIRKVRRKKKSKHTKRVFIEHPGQFTQIDVKYLTKTLKNGSRCYVYSFVDHASKWRFKRAFEMFGNLQTKNFVEELALHVPFQIRCLQSDNGAEFTNRFNSHPDAPKLHLLDEWCNSNSIRHKLIPPGEKELQGLVERNHRQDDEELYHRIERRVETIAGLNTLLDEHCSWCNSKRRRKALAWMTAQEWLAAYQTKASSVQELSVISDKSKEITEKAA